MIKNIQRHHYKNKILHLDFQRVNNTSLISTIIPIKFTNVKNCVGLKSGGKLHIKFDRIKIECEAKYLPNFINVDLLNLNIEENIFLSDIKLENNIQILDLKKGFNKIVVNIKKPKKIKTEMNKESNVKSSTTNQEDEKK